MKKSQAEATTAKNLVGKFDRGEEVLDYFDVQEARLIKPSSASSESKAKFAYGLKQHADRPAVVREKSAAYRKNTQNKAKAGR